MDKSVRNSLANGKVDKSRRSFLGGAGLAAATAGLSASGILSGLNGEARAASGEPIPIGCMTGLSGWPAPEALETKRGFEFAIEEINAAGGILGRPLEGHVVDTKNPNAEEVTGAANLLIDRHGVHAIVNGHNIGAQNAEYDTIADAGVIYIHTNTLQSHEKLVEKDPERFFGIFMGDPSEYWYGPGWLRLAAHLRDSGQWKPRSNKLALISGSSDYSITVIKAAEATAKKFGWEIVLGPEIVKTPTTEWGPVLAKLRDADPALLLHSELSAGDIAQFMIQFQQNPTKTLIYFPWGPLQAAFREIGGKSVNGVVSSTVMGLLEDDMGKEFQAKYDKRYGLDAGSTGAIAGCVSYGLLHHFAIAAAVAGGTGEPGNLEQNRKVAQMLKAIPFRTVFGTIRYHPKWQSAIPFPDLEEKDPSLGMPHLFYQIQDYKAQPRLIAPIPYDANKFTLPPWMA